MEWGCHPFIWTNNDSTMKCLFKVSFSHVSPKSPDLSTIHNSIIQKADVQVSCLTAKLEQCSLLFLLSYLTNIQNDLEQVAPAASKSETKAKKKKTDPETLESSTTKTCKLHSFLCCIG